MTIGTVKWYNPKKRFGFIAPEGSDKDVFVHITALEQAGLESLNEGQKISFDTSEENGKVSAVNLKLED
tara:strand:- start:1002 stop:1208 length:207 start_codon:yes stop_codon:yes gene_type:complete